MKGKYKMNFTTQGMSLEQRNDILNKVELIPIGTICYKAGDFTECTKKIIVNKDKKE